ncbi:unnamed protein product [Sphacelaria rigidula]
MAASGASDTLNQSWKNDKSKFGLKMLQKMGWTEGKGLGKNEDGVSEHVKVSKKSNNLGLGATRDQTGAAGWASTAVSFNGVLETLAKAYGTAHDSNEKKSKKRKKKSKKDKRRKKGESGNRSSSDGSTGSGSDIESNGSGTASVNAQGAYACPSRARRVRSKDVKSFSAEDLRAILGKSAGPSLPSYPVISGGDSSSKSSTAREKLEKAAAKSAKKKDKKRRREERISGSNGKTDDDGEIARTAGSPHRPRTRSMDLAERAETTPAAATATAADGDDSPPGVQSRQRPRTHSMDHAEGCGSVDENKATTATAASRSRKKRKDRDGSGVLEGAERALAEECGAKGCGLEKRMGGGKARERVKGLGSGNGSEAGTEAVKKKKRRKKESKA